MLSRVCRDTRLAFYKLFLALLMCVCSAGCGRERSGVNSEANEVQSACVSAWLGDAVEYWDQLVEPEIAVAGGSQVAEIKIECFLDIIEQSHRITINNKWRQVVLSLGMGQVFSLSYDDVEIDNSNDGSGYMLVSKGGSGWYLSNYDNEVFLGGENYVGSKPPSVYTTSGAWIVAGPHWPPAQYSLCFVDKESLDVLWCDVVDPMCGKNLSWIGMGGHRVRVDLQGENLIVCGVSNINVYIVVYDIKNGDRILTWSHQAAVRFK